MRFYSCYVLVLVGLVSTPRIGAVPVNYNREIRPILSDKCFRCHGPDAAERKAGLRLDVREEAVRALKSLRVAIVPGQPGKSALVERIRAVDAGDVMPPPEVGKPLSAAEKSLLERWISEGAEYQKHWAFEPVRRSPVPELAGPATTPAWKRNEIDPFVARRLELEGLAPGPEADRFTLVRRLSFDLIGLPPAWEEVQAFVDDASPDAYERLVDRLLQSPRFGERMALDWLDASRFADTNGYHIDNGRDMTRWREWVIDAYNHNLPFDRFTIEQLAGDLLPEASLENKVASGFHRNHMINFEGGAIPEEYHTAYIVDRVNTTATVWLGLTVACTQCHDHKYDPLTQKEFYQLFAFFYNVPEKGLDGNKGNAAPLLKLPTPAESERLEALAREIETVQASLAALPPQADKARREELEKPHRDKIAALEKARDAIEKGVRTTMVMQEMPRPRDAHLLVRGQYDRKGEKVEVGVPAVLPPLAAGAPRNRLGLAEWIVDASNPLTPRVITNRIWQMFFGLGLVKTSEDFGSQGEPPTHPELLDWLAHELVSSGWDIKRFVRGIVTSATYRQSSAVTSSGWELDPENRLLARGSRHRLQAELIRDQALAVSGLLDHRLGGKSVSPYQPPGLWEELMSRADGANWTAQTYVQSHGPDLYRRTLYTFWKRTSPPPTLATFDAPDRETCTVRRARTNTPLQALILMNDPTYVEASRKLAERLLREGGSSNASRLTLAFQLCLSRLPRPAEIALVEQILRDQLEVYRLDDAAARQLLAVGESPRAERWPVAELAAWTVAASAVLNLDETVTRG